MFILDVENYQRNTKIIQSDEGTAIISFWIANEI